MVFPVPARGMGQHFGLGEIPRRLLKRLLILAEGEVHDDPY